MQRKLTFLKRLQTFFLTNPIGTKLTADLIKGVLFGGLGLALVGPLIYSLLTEHWFTIVLLALVVFVACVCLFYYLQKTRHIKLDSDSPSYFYSASTRRKALVSLALLALFSVATALFMNYPPHKTPKITILIADFRYQAAVQNKYSVPSGEPIADALLDQLDEAFRSISVVSVTRLHKSIVGRDQAKEAAKRSNAALVLWGWKTDSGTVVVHYEVLPASIPLPLRESGGDFEITLAPSSITLQTSVQQLKSIVLVGAGVMRFWLKDYRSSIALLTEVIENLKQTKVIDFAGVFYYLGQANVHNGQPDEAIRQYNSALALNPTNPVSRSLVYSARSVAYAEVATKLSGVAVSFRPEGSAPQLTGGDNPEGQGYLDRAISDINEAMSLLLRAPEFKEQSHEIARLYSNRAVLHKDRRDLPKALADCQSALAYDRHYAMAYYNCGAIYAVMNRNSDALEHYNRALQLDSRLSNAYHERGDVYEVQQRFSAAAKDYQRALALAPNEFRFHLSMGNLLAKNGATREAIERYTMVIRLKPDFADVYVYRGEEFEKLNEPRKAIDDYTAAVGLKPQNYVVYCKRGALEMFVNRPDLGFQDFVSCANSNDSKLHSYATDQVALVTELCRQRGIDIRHWRPSPAEVEIMNKLPPVPIKAFK